MSLKQLNVDMAGKALPSGWTPYKRFINYEYAPPIISGVRLPQQPSVSQSRDATADELAEFELYDISNWDGYGAMPIVRATIQAARSLRRLLPSNLPSPDIAPGADGTIGFEWRLGSVPNQTLVLIDVGPGDVITGRRVDAAGKIDRLPATSLATGASTLIQRLFS
jgi:hypothetical protein